MKTNDEGPPGAGFYTPGYALPKALMILFGIVVFTLGAGQLKTPLRLLIFGEHTRAEATDVVKTKPGFPDVVLHDDAQIQSNLESRDRSSVFWNEFRFQTADGRAVTVRAPVGSQLKPLYPLLDENGLPTTDVISYDPGNPTQAVFPLILSTWFIPGVLTFAGLLATLIGSVLLYWANKPIALPHLPPAAPRSE